MKKYTVELSGNFKAYVDVHETENKNQAEQKARDFLVRELGDMDLEIIDADVYETEDEE